MVGLFEVDRVVSTHFGPAASAALAAEAMCFRWVGVANTEKMLLVGAAAAAWGRVAARGLSAAATLAKLVAVEL